MALKKKKKKKKQKPKKAAKTSGVAVQKPGFNVYTMMLILSLIAITTACILLYMELGTYGGINAKPWNVR